MKKKYRIRDYSFILIALVIAITAIGILAIGSASVSVQGKQLKGALLGIFIMVIVSLVDYTFILKFYWVYYFLNLALLIFVQIFGNSSGGAQRWVTLFGIQFQPSESAKILLILFYAQFIMVNKENLNKLKTILLMILLFIPPWLLIYKQPDLSTSIVIIAIFFVALFVGGIKYRYIFSFIAIAIPTVIILFLLIMKPNQTIINDYQKNRILAWLYPEEYSTTEGYQQNNSIIAIGSGQLNGKGLNNDSINSVKNGNFISEPQTDFIFAVIGEELGFAGSCTVVVLLMGISILCFNAGRKSKELSGAVICGGVGIVVGFQSFMNICVATGLMPNTGIPLPFVSAGVTSLLCMYVGIGFVLNVRLQCLKKGVQTGGVNYEYRIDR